MKRSKLLGFGVLVTALGGLIGLLPGHLNSQQGAVVRIDGDDIGGVVTSANGPEAGVWVIAETTNLPTKFAKIVVTDDQGRYLIPDLPRANYDIWVRGYGLIDSAEGARDAGKNAQSESGRRRRAIAAAAQYYPAIYWYSMLKIPDKSEFPGTGRKRQRHAGKAATSSAVAGRRQNQRLQYLPPDGQQGDANDPQRVGRIQNLHRGVAAAHRFRPGDDLDAQCHRSDRFANARSRCSPTGPIASPPANCPKQNRRGRKASSATSSLRCGIGAIPRLISTTKSPPTSASRRSMPTVRFTARRS